MYIINTFVLFEMNVAIIVCNEVILRFIWFVHAVSVITHFLLCSLQISDAHLHFGDVHTSECFLTELF